jgi:hypothetical protein
VVVTVGSIKVAFGADLSAYEASLKRGEKRTNDFERNTGKAVDGVGQQFIRLGGLAKAGLAGLATGLIAGGVTGIIGKFGDVARSVAEIGDEAKRAGLSARSFQELGYVAKANRIQVDSLTDGLKELSLRADEYLATGQGSAAESFKRLGYSAEDLKKKLADPAALFAEIIGKLGQLDRAAQIRIADEIFGGQGGEKFVQLIAQGEEGIRDTIAEAHRLGAVLDDDVIDAAAELDRKFNAVAVTVGTALKSAIVDAASALQKFIDQFRAFDERATSTLKDRFGELQTRYGQLVKQQGSWEDSALGLIGKDAATEMQAVKAEMDQVAAELRQRATPMLREKLVAAQSANTPYVPPPSTSGRSASTKAVRTERDAVADLIARLQEEKDLIGATDLQRDTANALRRAGAGATADQKAEIVSLVAAIHAEAEAQRQAADAQQLYGDIAKGVLSDLRGALADGKLSWEELGDVALNVLETATDRDRDIHLESIINGKA